MKDNNNHILLSRYIGRNDVDEVRKILEEDKSLNIMYKDGRFVRLAINNQDTQIVKTLLDYFKANQLGKYPDYQVSLPDDWVQYHLLKQQMQHILEIAIEDIELTQNMKKILAGYIDFEDYENIDCDAEEKLSEMDDLFEYYSDKDNNQDDYLEDSSNNHGVLLGEAPSEIHSH